MVYRKGEQPVPRQLDRWSPGHPVARVIASGTRWFDAWVGQKTTHYARLEKLTGIPARRLNTLSEGGSVSRAEVDALARAWCVSTADLIASMPDPSVVID